MGYRDSFGMGMGPSTGIDIYKPKAVADTGILARQRAEEASRKKFKEYMKQTEAARAKDLAAGRARGQQVFGEGSLGRVDANRSTEVSDILNRRLQESQGMTGQERTAARDQVMGGINRTAQTAARGLRSDLARSGIRGPALGKALATAERDRGANAVNAERELYLKNIDLRRSGLDAYEKSVGGARADELGRQQYNIGQGGKEKLGQLTTELGYGSLGAGERGAIMQRLVGEESADAARQATAAAAEGKK